jgi:phosphoglycolate phosphatase-like HAD superfamily hydrolase
MGGERRVTASRVAVFDLDGTLIDSDRALAAPFTALGIDPSTVPWGLPLPEVCDRVGVTVADYLAHYDPTAAQPYPGVDDLLAGLDRWGVCSNKHPDSGPAELIRLRWAPEATWFNEGHGPKRLEPVLEEMGLEPDRVIFVGDTGHDRDCARAVGCRFVLAGWNPRAERAADDIVMERPRELVDLLV